MAVEARLTKQMPWVGTVTQREIVERTSAARRTSRADVVRAALDAAFGLRDGELPDGQTIEQAVKAGMDRLYQS